MEQPVLPKFLWRKNFDHNAGHNKNEWGNSIEETK